jgi:hypothetical protein
MEKSTGPLEFTASFPRDARFAPTAGELAAKLAQASGCAEGASQELRDAVSAAFEAVLLESAADSAAAVGLVLHAHDASFATEVTCGARSFLRLAHPRSAA